MLRMALVLTLIGYLTSPTLAEEQESQASVSFLPAPEVPLYPETSEEFAQNTLESEEMKLQQKLPQTGEKDEEMISGIGIVTSVVIISYFRRKLLDYKL